MCCVVVTFPARLVCSLVARRIIVSLHSGTALVTMATSSGLKLNTPVIVTIDGEEYEQLNNYILKETLGNGSYGVVRHCTDQVTNLDYAIKIISKKRIKAKAGFSGRSLARGPSRRTPPARKSSGASSNPLDKIHTEIAILKKCKHENIVCLKEVIDDSESPEQNIYLVFELMANGQVMEEPNMSNKAQVNPLPLQTCKRFFRDLLLGLEYLHYQKIIHRDIKPSNLLLGNSGQLKIADFGVSEIFEGDRAVVKNSAGSPAFLPPEAVDPDIRSFDGQLLDLWACGVTLWIFCFGRVPFRGDSILKLHENIREAKLEFPESDIVTDSLKDLFQRLLAKNHEDRLSIEEAKVHPWVTDDGQVTLATREQNCHLVEVSEQEVANAVTCIKWGTMMRIYNIARNRSFKLRSDRKGRSLPKTPADNVQNSMGELHIEEPKVT